MAWNFGDEVQFGGGESHGARYITHFYCLAVEAGFYGDVVECLHVDPATWVRFPAWFRFPTNAVGNRLRGASLIFEI